jgi:hypothetical protein
LRIFHTNFENSPRTVVNVVRDNFTPSHSLYEIITLSTKLRCLTVRLKPFKAPPPSVDGSGPDSG